MHKKYLTRQEAAAHLGGQGFAVAPATLARWFSTTNDGPPVVHFGRKPLYPLDQLDAWLEGRLTAPRTSSAISLEMAHG